ncbi:MAG: hypothetical protein V1797_17215 [Pseudomonadota bacterium]
MFGRRSQLDLFDRNRPPMQPAGPVDPEMVDLAGLDVQRPLKAALGRALKGSSLSRELVVDRVNEIFGALGSSYKMTAPNLDRWTAVSDATHNIPAFVVPVLCAVLESIAPLEAMLSPLGLTAAGVHERLLMRFGETQRLAEKLNEERRRTRQALSERGL